MRAIGQLESAEPVLAKKDSRSTARWTRWHGIVAGLGLIICFGGLAVAAYWGYWRAQLDTSLTVESQIEQTATLMEESSPGELWAMYSTMENRGLGVRQPPEFYRRIMAAEVADGRIRTSFLVSAGGLVLLLGTLLASFLGKAPAASKDETSA
jgi:hypothetical protein